VSRSKDAWQCVHVSPTQMIMLQGCCPCCPPRVTSAADNLVEGLVDGYRHFHRTFRLLSINASRCPSCLPMLKTRIPWHISYHCGDGPACLLTGHSAPPLQWCCCHLQLCLCSDDGERRRETMVGWRLAVLSSRAVCQLCLCSDLADMGLHHLPLGRPMDGCQTIM